jgi:hypothetical protein
MMIVTSIYCAKVERTQDALSGKHIELNAADLKQASRDLMRVYQGTNRPLPMDGDR